MYGDFDGFVSKPLWKLTFPNGFGIYLLTAHEYRLLPRFSLHIRKDGFECGVFFANVLLELMYNKHFKYEDRDNRI